MYQAVVVFWDDIVSYKGGGWSQSATSGPPESVMTAGWITDENDKYITIHSTLAASGNVGHDTVIPRGIITRIVHLEQFDQDPGELEEYYNEITADIY